MYSATALPNSPRRRSSSACCVELALGVQQFQSAVDAGAVALGRQIRAALGAGHRPALGGDLPAEGFASSQAVGHFAEGGLDRAFVFDDGAGLAQLGQAQLDA
ncbi:hypothetical protein BKX93_10790 [Chromobacterium vaccinii]|uniref:Uncharacterized protein n=1 Tax=Chromobacterium vaccinii TaxID=1108595 RepID=A0A1D9LGN4_9NEIS|nr:hypothetical protein BKX93_10790 [Chromobacterium vaccinii]